MTIDNYFCRANLLFSFNKMKNPNSQTENREPVHSYWHVICCDIDINDCIQYITIKMNTITIVAISLIVSSSVSTILVASYMYCLYCKSRNERNELKSALILEP